MRIFDIVFSLLAITILLPFMLFIMIILKFTGEHHVFFLQPRIGKNGKEFNIIKFATMLRDSPNMQGGYVTHSEDPRILPLGQFFRRTKINELPQLFNILMGQMSFVGPRPTVQPHLALYPDLTREKILEQTPGLTGIGSLVFRDEEGILSRVGKDGKRFHDEVITPYKGELELWYSKHQNLAVYLTIILLTARSLVVPRSQAYRKLFHDLPAVPTELELFL